MGKGEAGGGTGGDLCCQILSSVSGHEAQHGGPLVCTGKIDGTDMRSHMGGPVPFSGKVDECYPPPPEEPLAPAQCQ